MTTMLKLMLAGLFALGIAACGEDPLDLTTDTEPNVTDTVPEDTNVDTTVVADKMSLVGKTYLVSFEPNWWNKPEGAGADIGAYVPGFLLNIVSVDPVAMTFQALLATAKDDGTQNECNKTVMVSGNLTDTTSTAFKTAPIDFEAILTGPADSNTGMEPNTITPIRSFTLGGSFTNQGGSYKNGSVDAVMDLRNISCLFMLITDPANRNPTYICQEMKDTLNYTCEICADKTSNCVVMQALYFRGNAVSTLVSEVPDFVAGCVDTSACN